MWTMVSISPASHGFLQLRKSGIPATRNIGFTGTPDFRPEPGLIPGLPSIEKEAEKSSSIAPKRTNFGCCCDNTKKRRVVLGVVTWYPEDQIEVERLSKLHGKDEVESAADSIRASGIEPLPGRVAQELQRQASAAKKASAEKNEP